MIVLNYSRVMQVSFYHILESKNSMEVIKFHAVKKFYT